MTHAPTFQQRVAPWMQDCFGAEISSDKTERLCRFFEEAAELVQAGGLPRAAAHQLVEYVYNRDVGEVPQEMGGVMVTLAALGLAHGEDMHEVGEKELARVWTKKDEIRAKQAAKPTNSALPEHVNSVPVYETVKADWFYPDGDTESEYCCSDEHEAVQRFVEYGSDKTFVLPIDRAAIMSTVYAAVTVYTEDERAMNLVSDEAFEFEMFNSQELAQAHLNQKIVEGV